MTPIEQISFQDVNTPALRAELAALAHIIWQQHYVPIIGQAQVDYMLAQSYSEQALQRDQEAGARYTLARKGDRFVGYVAVAPPRPDRPDCAWLDKLYVMQDARNLGIGRRLLYRVLEQADTLWRARMIALRVNRDNEASIAAYRAMGFSICDTHIKDIGDGFVMDDYIMDAPLHQLRSGGSAVARPRVS